MTYKEILGRIDFTDKKIETTPAWDELCEELNINSYIGWSDDTKLKCYHVKTWYCTDTYVGWIAYFLNDEFVCLSKQTSRKGYIYFFFKDKESAFKVKSYLESLLEIDVDIQLINLDEVVEDKYQVSFSKGILHKTAWYKDEKVFIKRNVGCGINDIISQKVNIIFSDGKEIEVNTNELYFDYNTLN